MSVVYSQACKLCGSDDVVLDVSTADRICRDCGCCEQDLGIGWECPEFSAMAHTTHHRKSVHDKNAYFKKKLVASCFHLSSKSLEELLRLFRRAEHAFRRLVTKRKYSPSYNYVCAQLLRLLGKDLEASLVPKLKGSRKLRELDATWTLVCAEAGWLFSPLHKWRHQPNWRQSTLPTSHFFL